MYLNRRVFIMDLSVSSSSWCLGRAAVCDYGTPWTFLLPVFFEQIVSRPHCPVAIICNRGPVLDKVDARIYLKLSITRTMPKR